jgi:hypothetical protein
MKQLGIPVKIQKGGQVTDAKPLISPESSGSAASHKPQVQLIEVEPGVYDIVYQCSCGQRSIIRCESVERPKAAE